MCMGMGLFPHRVWGSKVLHKGQQAAPQAPHYTGQCCLLWGWESNSDLTKGIAKKTTGAYKHSRRQEH